MENIALGALVRCRRRNITGIITTIVISQALMPVLSNPKMPPVTINPSAKVNAAVARRRWRFSSSLKCQSLPVWCSIGCL